MRLFEKTTNLSIMLGFGLLVLGCGENPEDNSALEMAKGPPQIKIALHSQLELDFSLDPAPKLRVSKIETDKLGAVDNKSIAGVNENYKKISILPPQSARRQAFEKDTEYQSIQRYEHMESYAITIEKSLQNSQIRKTVKADDKPLVFAGRGYNISAFERENKPAIDLDYATHLLSVNREPTSLHLKKKLDSEGRSSRDRKYLIYNSTRSAFGKLPPPLIESKPDLSIKSEPLFPPKRNVDSVLLLPPEGKSILVLRKSKKQFDLLTGNESLNKKSFQASKVLETSKKTPNILQ
ncbi:MAG: hypothetical protein CMH73_00690 [Nitrospina sp.]|nr:hypothetical protein [Nitrospina sp.]